jgi:aldehyde:ferredoxin oxidoreductase
MSGGYMGKMLVIDLTSGDTEERPIPEEDRRLYLGNKIYAAKLLHELTPPGVDPLGPDNVFIVNTGPLTGSGTVTSSRFNATAKSPLTGAIGSSNCGGDFGVQLKKCGYDGLILLGKAPDPVSIHIGEEGVEIREAGELWGLTTEDAAATVEKGAGYLVIGPAGENLVRFANIMSGDRCLGRCGMGAVLGSKNVKLITARGKKKIPIHDVEAFRAHAKKWTAHIRSHPITGEILPRLGTAHLIRITNATYTLPTRNFRRGRFEHAEAISGETLAETRLVANKGCKACPIQCGRVVEHAGKRIKGPEFETLGMLGPHIENHDLDRIIEWNYKLDLLGMDTISMGGTLGCAMELTERGLLDSGLAFGKPDRIMELIEDTAYRRGLGAELAEGSRELARRHGAPELAMQARGLEFAAYEPRGAVGHGLGYATANRGGCHLNGGYMVFFEATSPMPMDGLTPVGKAALCVFQQDVFEAVSAGGSCLFTTYAVMPAVPERMARSTLARKINNQVMKALRFPFRRLNWLSRHVLRFHLPLIHHTKAIELLTGIPMPLGDFIQIGERGFNIERMYNLREGVDGSYDALPPRLTDEPQRPEEPRSRVPLAKMLPEYYCIRGWDSRGVPTAKRLRELGLEWLIQD